MPIKFKVIERGQPGVAGGGEKKYYASAVSDGEITLTELTKSIERSCTVNGADIRAVLYALVDVATENLSNGTIVRLGDLGSLRVSISAEGKTKASEVNAASIKSASIIFTPGTRLKELLSSAKYQKE